MTGDCSVSRMLPLAFEIEFLWVASYLVSASEQMDPASAFGLHFLMQEVSVPVLLTVCLLFSARVQCCGWQKETPSTTTAGTPR